MRHITHLSKVPELTGAIRGAASLLEYFSARVHDCAASTNILQRSRWHVLLLDPRPYPGPEKARALDVTCTIPASTTCAVGPLA